MFNIFINENFKKILHLEFDQTCRHDAVKKIMAIAITTFYYVFIKEERRTRKIPSSWRSEKPYHFLVASFPLYFSFIFVQVTHFHSSSLYLKCALRKSGCRIGYEPTKMSRDHFWRSISRDTNVEVSAL